MAVRQTALLTAEDYRLLPATGPQYQLIGGELHMSAAPNRYHQDISRNIEFLLLKYLENHPSGKLYHAPFDVYLTLHDVFQPDILWVANDRLVILTDEGAAGAPTLIIEILSPTTAPLDRSTKKQTYRSTGVEELWLVDPANKTIEIYRLQHDVARPAGIFRHTDRFASACFPGLEILAENIFKA